MKNYKNVTSTLLFTKVHKSRHHETYTNPECGLEFRSSVIDETMNTRNIVPKS